MAALLAVALLAALLLAPALAADPVFSPYVTRPGFSNATRLSTYQPNTYIRFTTGTITSDTWITDLFLDLTTLNALGHVYSATCPSGASVSTISNNMTLHCNPNATLGESGIASSSSVNISLYLDEVKSTVGTNPAQVHFTLTDAAAADTTMTINFTIQNRPAIASAAITAYPANASKGQASVPVTFRTINNAASPASPANYSSISATLLDYGGAPVTTYQVYQSPSGNPVIVSGESVNHTFSVDIPMNAATGTMTHSFNATFTDENSGIAYTSASVQDILRILSAPNLAMLAVLNSTQFISRTIPNNTLNLTLRVNNTGEAAANITGTILRFYDYLSNDVTGNFTYVPTNPFLIVYGGQQGDYSLNVTGTGTWPGGIVRVNYTVNYWDPAATHVPYGPLAGNRSDAFTYDTTAPTVTVVSTSAFGGTYVRPTSPLSINASVSDTFSGIPAGSSCYVSFGNANIPALTGISYSSGWCNGTITVPADPQLYGSLPLKVTIPDAVSNNGTGSLQQFLYTALVYTRDAVTEEHIYDKPNMSYSTVQYVNASGAGGTATCQAYGGFNDSSHFCGMPYGSVVNFTSFSPGFVWNPSQGNVTVCIGGNGDINNCDTATPTDGRVIRNLTLIPNTEIVLSDEFGNPVAGFNITVNDTTGWTAYLSDGASSDENSSAGKIWFPLDTGKHQVPFTIAFNLAPNYNNTGLSSWQAQVSPNNLTQSAVSQVARFSILLRLFDEFGGIINETGGSIIYNPTSEFGSAPVVCISNSSDRHVYGCRVPTVAELGQTGNGSFQGSYFAISKTGYVDMTSARILPPASPAAAQAATNQSVNFTIVVIPRDYYNITTLTAINSSTLHLAGACRQQGSLWGCPASVSDTYVNVTPANSSGFVRDTVAIAPSSSLRQVVYSRNRYSIHIYPRDELNSTNLTSGDISSVGFGGGAYICANGGSLGNYSWGCPVPAGSAASTVSVNVTAGGRFLNYVVPSITPPASPEDSFVSNFSYNKYPVKVLTSDEFGRSVSVAGAASYAWGGSSATACTNSNLSEWYCPVATGASLTSGSIIPGYLTYNQSLTAPLPTGDQAVLNSSNRFPVLVYARDEVNAYPDIRLNGNVTFSGLQCVNASAAEYQKWGCAVPWNSNGTVSVTAPGFIDWNSSTRQTDGEAGSQDIVFSSLGYTLLVNLTDELGQALSGATVTPTGLSQPGCTPSASLYYCPVSSGSTTVSFHKQGFVNLSASASGLSSSGPQVVLQATNTSGSGMRYSANVRVTRETNNSNQEMSSGVTFVNTTTGAAIAPAGTSTNPSLPNVFYFALQEGTQDILVRKAGYIDSRLVFSTSTAVPYENTGTGMRFALKLGLFTENGTEVLSGAGFSPTTHHRNDSATTPYYYFPLSGGTAVITVTKSGFVTSNATVPINTTYPSSQAQHNLTLPYTVKVSSVDWGAAPLNGTNVTVFYSSNGTAVSSRQLPSTENRAYFEIPGGAPAMNISVQKSGYNSVALSGILASEYSQANLTSSHAQGISVNISDWHALPVQSATAVLYRNSLSPGAKVATCAASAAGICSFLSVNGAADLAQQFFNSSGLAQGDTMYLSVSSPGFATIERADGTYYYQNSSSPLDAGNIRIGGRIVILVRKAWNLSSPISGVTVSMINSSSATVATAVTNSTGGVLISPDYYASASQSDALVSPAEMVDLTAFTVSAQKAGFATATSLQAFNSSRRLSAIINLSDSAPPVFQFYWQDGSPYDGNESSPYEGGSVSLGGFAIAFSLSDPYLSDGSGVDSNRTYYRITNSTGGSVLGWSQACAGSVNCSFNITGDDIPVGNLTVSLNSTDNSNQTNVTNFSIQSLPAVRVNSISFIQPTAYSNGNGSWNFSFNISVKGDYAAMKLSDFAGLSGGYLNISDASCPGGSCANMTYFNSTSCTPRQVAVGNNYSGSALERFCDLNGTSAYLRDQQVFLRVMVPVNTQTDKYNATYGFAGGVLP